MGIWRSQKPLADYSEEEVALNRAPGVAHFVRFAERSTTTAAGGDEVIWQANATFTPMTTADTFDINYNSGTDGSGTTGATVLLVTYLDSSFLQQEATVVLGSTGTDETTFSGLGIQRAVVVASGANDANGNDITFTTTTGGDTQGVIPAGDSVTKSSVYHAPINTSPVLRELFLNVNKSGGGTPKAKIKLNVYNRLIDTKFELLSVFVDTGVESTVIKNFPSGFTFSGRDVIWWTIDTDTNNTNVLLTYSLNVLDA